MYLDLCTASHVNLIENRRYADLVPHIIMSL